MAGYDKLDFAKDVTHCAMIYTQPKHGIDLPLNKIPGIEDIARDNLKNAIKRINPKPEWFVIDDYVERWAMDFRKFLNRENYKKLTVRNDNKAELLDAVVNTLKSLIRVMNKEYENWHQRSLKEFLESDLSLGLYNLYTTSYIERVRAMDYVAKRLRELRQKIFIHRGNDHKISKTLTSFYSIGDEEILQALSKTLRSEITLRMYIVLINSKNIDDLFESRSVRLKGDKELAGYVDKYKEQLFRLTVALNKSGVKDSNLISPPLKSFENFGIKLQQIVAKHE